MSTLLDVAPLAAAVGLDDPAIAVIPLSEGGPEARLAVDRDLYPASMIKVPLALAALADVAAGRYDLTSEVVVSARNMTANDWPSPFVTGFRTSVGALIHHAIADSDNVATNELIDLVGRDRATQVAHEFGLARTAIRRKLSGADPLIDDPEATGVNSHPASDAARLFALIARQAIPGAAVLTEALRAQRWNTKLSAGLREGDRFLHKTGETSRVSHDGGILMTAGGARFVVIVYSALPTSDAADRCFETFMRELRPRLGP